MRVWPFPKKWLIHTIEYREITDQKDDWDNPIFAPPITIKNVRFDDSTVFSRDATQTQILADAVIFVDATHSTNIPSQFVEESKITLLDKNGNIIKSCTLKKDVPCYYPDKNAIHHWELEVI